MNRLVKPGRLAFLGFLGALVMVVFLVALYKLQIIEGTEYYERSKNNIVSTKTVSGVRGSIMDRYGRVLVENRSCTNLTIDDGELLYERSSSEANEIILTICKMILDQNGTYTDELPITKTVPFQYTEMSPIQRELLNAWLKANDLPQSASAVDVMAQMRKRYKIDNSYSGEDMRIIAGVRYEINVRYLIGTSDYVFAEDVSLELITYIMEHDIPGFNVSTDYIREYKTSSAPHLLGYIGMMNEKEMKAYTAKGYSMDAKVGKDGAEAAFEEYLHGTDGKVRTTSTSTGIVTDKTYVTEPVPGNHVYLTIDIGLQEAAETALDTFITEANEYRAALNEDIEKYGGFEEDLRPQITGGACVVVNVKTGEPLAIASLPSFDLEYLMDHFAEVSNMEGAPMFNRALQGTYAPGSTFKPCTAIAGLAEGVIDVPTKIECEGIFRKYEDAGYAPRCWIYGQGLHGELTVPMALTVSCNYFFYTVGDMLQITKLAKYAKMFGLGEPTGIEIYEDIGRMASDEYMNEMEGRDMYAGDTLAAAIGQSISLFNPLQMAEYCAAIANNGVRYSASVLKTVRNFDYSATVYTREVEVLSKVDVRQDFFDLVHEGMYGVANDPMAGSVYESFLGASYSVAAKTGTAQTGTKNVSNGFFICYAPYDDPEIAVCVSIEKAESGASISPIARKVMDYYFNFKNSTATLEHEGMYLR
ncbi:MAG: hypothetical protein MJ067_05215 [Oscillospiraceae bacterium]|nr:hypothetical protein [Oscillospiraceae bacterium]